MKGCPYFLEAPLEVEDNLRSGVVATSSLDLGVDFSSVDAVIQIGSTRGIARLLNALAGRTTMARQASVVCVLSAATEHRRFMPTFVVSMGLAALLATVLHGIEAATWAIAYRLLGAVPDTKSAMLYSLSAITSCGHANLFLEEQWQLMGALEALNGLLLFGLTTAFLFAMIQKVWPLGSRGWHRKPRSTVLIVELTARTNKRRRAEN